MVLSRPALEGTTPKEGTMRGVFGIDPGWGITPVRVVMALVFVGAGYTKMSVGMPAVTAAPPSTTSGALSSPQATRPPGRDHPPSARSALRPDEPTDHTAGEHNEDRREPARGEDHGGRRSERGGHPVVHRRARERVDARSHEADADGRERPLDGERPRSAPQPLPPSRDKRGQQGGRHEHRGGRHQRSDEAVGPVADEDRHEHAGAGGELREGVAVHEFSGGDPPVARHDLALHLGEDPEASTHGDEAEPEKRRREMEQIGHQSREGRVNQRLTGRTRQTARGVVTPSGPTSTNIATATATAILPRSDAVTSCAVVTSTRPTTVAPIPCMNRVAPGANAPRT